MEYILVGFSLGIGFLAGLYVATQIGLWIKKNINNDKS